MRTTPARITTLQGMEVFVFGSNMLGSHGGGAAYQAIMNGWAKNKVFYGMVVNDQMEAGYAIPTLGFELEPIPLTWIRYYVKDFIKFARRNSHLKFYVTAIGCGIAGRSVSQMAPMFKTAERMKNVWLPKEFKDYLKNEREKRKNIPISVLRSNGNDSTGDSSSS